MFYSYIIYNISDTEYEFKSTINENHLNAAGITHGGYLAALVDAGAGTAAHRSADNAPCVTISLDLKFIGATKVGDEIIVFTNAFHGRSMLNITAGDSEFQKTGFGPLLKGFKRAKFNNLGSVKKILSKKT